MLGLDGGHSGKTLDSGANAATNTTDFSDAIHEGAHQDTAVGDKMTGHGESAFDKSGVIAKHFTSKSAPAKRELLSGEDTNTPQSAEGAIGGTAQKIGGPLSQDGSIGKAFTTEGSLGGLAQSLADKNKFHLSSRLTTSTC